MADAAHAIQAAPASRRADAFRATRGLRALALGGAVAALCVVLWPAADSPHYVALPRASEPAANGRVAGTSSVGLPRKWCGSEAEARAGVEHMSEAERRGRPVVKVIIARPADAPDRFRRVADAAQAMASDGALWVAQESGGRKTLRFDLGTSSCAGALDLAAVTLPHTRADYLAGAALGSHLDTLGVGTYWRVRADLMRLVPHAPEGSARNFLVIVDGLSIPGLGGRADRPADDRPGPDNAANRGGSVAVVFADFGPEEKWSATTALHELWHTFGAVQDSAPNATPAGVEGHLTDGGADQGVPTDLMAYSDAAKAKPACPGWAETVLQVRLDCGRDDFWAPPEDLTPGSYLATHWNTYNSVFLAPCGGAPLACGRMPEVLGLARRAPAEGRTLTLRRDACAHRCPSARAARAAGPTVRIHTRWEPWGTLRVSARLPRAGRGREWRLCLRTSDAQSSRAAARGLRRGSGGEHCWFPERDGWVRARIEAGEQMDTRRDRVPARYLAPALELRASGSWRLRRSYNVAGRQVFSTVR